MTDLTMPSLGADMESGTLLEWLVRPGDTVRRGQPVAVVDTDKAAIEIESFHDGTMGSLLVQPGTRVAVGAPIARIGVAGDGAPAVEVPGVEAPVPAMPAEAPVVEAPVVEAPATEATVVEPPVPVTPAAEPVGVDGGHEPRVSPYARRLAAELGVDVATVAGTGSHGAVRADDVRAAAAARTPEPPAPEAAAPRKRVARDTIAALMSRANRDIPHYYVATTVDMLAVTTWLRRVNRERPVAERIVPAAAILKATALAARAHPELNGFWVDDRFVPAEGVHLGVAVSVREGALVAPALHDAADLDLGTLMSRLRDLVGRARSGRLTRAEVADPTLTVTDLGDQGVEEVLGVIYPPQVALVGVGRMVERPWAVDGMLAARPVVHLSLSGDHRATDGAAGSRFLVTVARLLQEPGEL